MTDLSRISYKGIEQRTLEALERIEVLLTNLTNHIILVDPPAPEGDVADLITDVTPTDTPFMNAVADEAGDEKPKRRSRK